MSLSDRHHAAESATPEPEAKSASSEMVELARTAASGNAAATHQLLRALAPKVRGIVRAVLGAAHPDLDDAIQQALIGFVQALPAFRGDCDPLGYARVIALRTSIAVRKRGRVRDSRRDAEAEPEQMAEARPSPVDSAGARERQELLRDLLGELPEEQAETIALRIIFGLSLEEVARETGVPMNTVRSRVRLAKERLKARIERDSSLAEALVR